MLGCALLRLLSRLCGGTLTSWIATRVVADLRSQLHAVLQRHHMRYFDTHESDELVSRVMHDTQEVQQFLVEGSPYFLVNTLSFAAIAWILFKLDVPLALLVLVPVPFLVGGGRWFWAKLGPMFHRYSTRIAALQAILGESIRGVKTIKSFSNEAKRIARFNEANERLFGMRYELTRTYLGFSEGMFGVMSIGAAAVWFVGAARIARGDTSLTVGELLAFVGYIWLFYGPLQWFTAILNWMSHAFSSADRIFSVLDAPEEVYDDPESLVLPEIKGAIEFKDVHFSYERGREVIKGVTFRIAAGEMIGLVGKSGAGKSTLVNLICRFYDVDSGEIAIDGCPIKKMRLSQLRKNIGVVMQEPFLFNASILENIAYGKPDAAFEEVVAAARAANAHEFILGKPHGYDTMIGERGGMLSTGERQRLAIARALLHDPPVLILDEATSSVDTETERAIQEALMRLVSGRTTIAIAHRLSTLRNADRIMVLDDGRVVEIGTHDELLAAGGAYAKLASIQADLARLQARVWSE